MKFWKYQAAGNDFVLTDDMSVLSLATENRARLCDRKLGIGADGMLVLTDITEQSFVMNYFNADGRPAEMCGNGARACVAWFCEKKNKSVVNFMTARGSHYKGEKKSEFEFAVTMNELSDVGSIDLKDLSSGHEAIYMNTGVPHCVFMANSEQDFHSENFCEWARAIRLDPRFSQGTNVNLIYKDHKSRWSIRTFERGVEDETLACGTGTVAAARWIQQLYAENLIEIQTKGGKLTVQLKENQCFLAGPVECVFVGQIEKR